MGRDQSLELKRIYRTRHLMRLAVAVLIVWISAAAILTAMANASKSAAGRRATSATGIFTIPSPAQQERLERRRLTYVELEDAVRVGERRTLP